MQSDLKRRLPLAVLLLLLLALVLALVSYWQTSGGSPGSGKENEAGINPPVTLTPSVAPSLTPSTIAPGAPTDIDVAAAQDAISPGVEPPGTVQPAEYSGASIPGSQTPRQTRSSAASPDANADENTPRLSQRVFAIVSEVQTRQLAGQWEEALNEMNALYRDFDQLSSFEQSTLLNFYTNTLLQLQMWQESISAFALMLTIPELRADVNARALLALGQLHTRVEEPQIAIGYYLEWLRFTAGMDNMEEQTGRVLELIATAQQQASSARI